MTIKDKVFLLLPNLNIVAFLLFELEITNINLVIIASNKLIYMFSGVLPYISIV